MTRRSIAHPLAALALLLGANGALGQAAHAPGPAGPTAGAKGAAVSPAASRDALLRASRILGVDVISRSGEKIGDVEDIVLDRNGNVAFAIVSTGAFLGVGNKLHAVPWKSLQPTDDAGHFMLDIDRDRLAQAPGFDPNDVPDLSDPKWSAANRRHFPIAAPPRGRAAASSSGRAAGHDIGPTTATARRSGQAAGAGSMTASDPSATPNAPAAAATAPTDRNPAGGVTGSGALAPGNAPDQAPGSTNPGSLSIGNSIK